MGSFDSDSACRDMINLEENKKKKKIRTRDVNNVGTGL